MIARIAAAVGRIVNRVLFAVILLATPTLISAASERPKWLLGVWQIAHDEDGFVGIDLNEFRADGQFVIYGPKCSENMGTYHMFNGDAYITFDVPDKGPIAMIYRPSKDHSQLIYTSPRTRHNAIYERALTPLCHGK